MKKFFSLLAVMAISSSLFAITLGVTGDIGFNTMLSETTTVSRNTTSKKSDTSEAGFNGKIGAIIGIDLADFIAVEPEFLLHFGNTYLSTNADTNSKMEISYNTIEIPVLAKLKIGFGPGKIALVAGPAFNFAIGDVTSYATFGNQTSKTVSSISDAGINGFIFSGVVGLEYQFRAGPIAIAAGGRYNIDISPSSEKTVSYLSQSVTSSMRRSNFEFNVAAKLFL